MKEVVILRLTYDDFEFGKVTIMEVHKDLQSAFSKVDYEQSVKSEFKKLISYCTQTFEVQDFN